MSKTNKTDVVNGMYEEDNPHTDEIIKELQKKSNSAKLINDLEKALESERYQTLKIIVEDLEEIFEGNQNFKALNLLNRYNKYFCQYS